MLTVLKFFFAVISRVNTLLTKLNSYHLFKSINNSYLPPYSTQFLINDLVAVHLTKLPEIISRASQPVYRTWQGEIRWPPSQPLDWLDSDGSVHFLSFPTMTQGHHASGTQKTKGCGHVFSANWKSNFASAFCSYF